jgi:hypothetical protein
MQYANHIGYSDITPFEVVRTVSEQTLDIREMNYTRDPNWKMEAVIGGFSAHIRNQSEQAWMITSNPEGHTVRIRRKKNGTWQDKWGNKYALNTKPVRFYDFNF